MSISEHGSDLAGSADSQGWANVSGQVYGFVDPAADSDWFVTWLRAGTRYTITMQGVDFDALLVLRNAGGDPVAVADGMGVDGTETISYTPSASGVFYLDAQSYRPGPFNTGFYVIGIDSTAPDDWRATPATSSTLQHGVARGGAIEVAADADWHRVALAAGRAYAIDATGTLPAPYLRVFDELGLETGTAGSTAIVFRPASSGRYHIEVSGNTLTEIGAYTLRVRELPLLSVASVIATEGDDGRTTAEFVLRLAAPSPQPVTVRVQTVDQTAIAGLDYQALHRVVTIPAGQTSLAVGVEVLGNPFFQPDRVFELRLDDAVGAIVDSGGFGFIDDDDPPPGLSLPDDELFGFQWYLHAVRAPFAWPLATGRGVAVGVFDQGIDAGNADLRANTDLAAGRDAVNLAAGGGPVLADDLHGTWVAGVIGAARDGHGVVGIAYEAELVGIYSSLALGARYLTEIGNAFRYAISLDVLNNSWGFGNLLQAGTDWAFLDDAADPAFAPAFAALRELAAGGRGGLGTVVVQSAGNSYSFGDDTNLHNFQNSRYVVTVGATDHLGQVSPFSTYGASILVSAPGGGGSGSFDSILTTDRSGAAGQSSGDFSYVDGTSFSAPVVSGIVALMLEANPRLGYRDVQQILAYTARRTDIGVGEWQSNGATDWNNGGLHFNALEHATGFGQVDALAAVRLAASWETPPRTVANAKEFTLHKAVGEALPDDTPLGSFTQLTVDEPMVVERVDVRVNIEHGFVGDLSIVLSSPAGTTSFLLWRPAQGALSAFGSTQDDVHFTFDTVLNWGEDGRGAWSLGVSDLAAGDTGRMLDWTLALIGRPASADDVYVYTNEYPDIVAADPTRALLRDDDGGRDTVNAAALGLDNRIDLGGATASMLNGAELRWAPGTVPANATGGDGNDTLIGNGLSNRLRGGPGNDAIDGAGGIDTAVYAGQRAAYTVTRAADAWRVGTAGGRDGDDVVAAVERLAFADLGLALDTGVDGHAGRTAQILRALFGPSYVQNPDFAAIGIELFDQGFADEQIVGLAIATPLFAQLAGGRSNANFVGHVYRNVVGTPPDAATAAQFSALLDGGVHTQTSLGVLAAGIELNAQSVQLVGLVETGLPYALGEG